jgi:FKBP-type peptidyl-prolyl cis-trans isomerase (trigger factor)
MDIQEITSAIKFGNLSAADINAVIESVKYARAQLAKQQARALRAGDQVRFSSRGNTFFGTIERVKLKNAFVKVGMSSRFNVPLNMLEAV